MQKLYKLAKGHTDRFPNGDEPFQITTRILEECGEVAQAVNHLEKSGIKSQKYGEPSKKHLADEIKQAMCALTQLIQYYDAEQDFELSLNESLQRIDNEKG